jgi:hypothetical protein
LLGACVWALRLDSCSLYTQLPPPPLLLSGPLVLYSPLPFEMFPIHQSCRQGTRAVLPPPAEGKPPGAGDFVWTSYGQVQEQVECLGSALVHNNFIPPQSEGQLPVVGIFSRNRAEWVVSQQACYSYGYTVVPLYSTLGADAVRFAGPCERAACGVGCGVGERGVGGGGSWELLLLLFVRQTLWFVCWCAAAPA